MQLTEEGLKSAIDRAFDTLDLDEFWAVGFFVAIHTGPDVIAPSTWFGLLAEDVKSADATLENESFLGMLAVYEGIGLQLREDPENLPPKGEVANDEAIRDFCSGYFHGAKLHEHWKDHDEAVLPLFTFAVLADEVDDDLLESGDAPVENPAEWRASEIARLGERVRWLRDFWRDKKTARVTSTKVGRNDPCPCGSGKKYKKCCIDAEVTYRHGS